VTPAIPIARIAPKKPLPRRSDLNIVAITAQRCSASPLRQRQRWMRRRGLP
jgi:hypothetical protein